VRHVERIGWILDERWVPADEGRGTSGLIVGGARTTIAS